MRRNILIIISFLTLLVASGCTNLDEKCKGGKTKRVNMWSA